MQTAIDAHNHLVAKDEAEARAKKEPEAPDKELQAAPRENGERLIFFGARLNVSTLTEGEDYHLIPDSPPAFNRWGSRRAIDFKGPEYLDSSRLNDSEARPKILTSFVNELHYGAADLSSRTNRTP